MRASQEVPQRNKLAMVLILDIYDAPAVLAASYLAPTYDNRVLGAYDSKGDEVFDGGVCGALFLVLLVVVVGVHAKVMEGEFLLDSFFECHAFF